MSEYKHGQWNVICDRCGFKYKSKQMKLQWDGVRACFGPGTSDCWEPRHPQDRVRGKKDKQSTAWSRPEAPDQFITPGPINTDDL